MEFFYVVKATQKSGKQDAVIWFTAKTESRALLQLDVELEDAGIETGRGKDYLKPQRTDFPVYSDLPEESTIDYTWCDRYELEEDGRTWQLKAGKTPVDEFHPLPDAKPFREEHSDLIINVDPSVAQAVRAAFPEDDENSPALLGECLATTIENEKDLQRSAAAMQERAFTHTALPFEKRVFGTWLFGLFDELTPEQSAEASSLELDMDAHYAQNVMLACRNVAQLKHVFPETLADLFAAAKSVWPVDGKAPLLSNVMAFFNEWIDTHTTGKTSREDVTAKWQKKYGSHITRTDSGTNAGGGNKTDRNQDYAHTLDALDIEIAAATLPMDFDIYETPGPIHRRAQEIVKKKESPFKEWSAALRSTPGILSFSRAAIFALVRGATGSVHHFPASLTRYITANLTEIDHENPTDETLAAARQIDSGAVVAAVIKGTEPVESLDKLDTPFADVGKRAAAAVKPADVVVAEKAQPEVQNLGAGMFSIDGLMGSTTTTQEAAHEQMETTVPFEDKTKIAVSPGESADEAGQQTATLTPAEVLAAAAPSLAAASAPEETLDLEESEAPVYPEYFEPGRYEGLPNNVYHAANGISSTQVKDARVSLMYFNARHVAKTIARESTEALTFGSLVHALALEPEKFDEEFAVFPGVPAEAFTNTDSLKAFIREYNADKPKAEQLKLTGKKEELQESIRAVNPDAIFADEYEEQWRQSMTGKTIISIELLASAKAIQQALFCNSDAHSLLCNPERQSEVSYFGIDEETGLEIRVRPDIEIRTAKDNICADLKTISIGNVRQDRLKERLHREIIDRDYHLSAAMYCDVAGLDSFSWIFVNKEPGYHWVAVVQASEMELELGRREYRRALRQINEAMESGIWPAPIVGTYTDELNNYDILRLDALAAE